ncbi:MAG TPA: hypothetical protein VML01_02225, partial [Bryobacterales bacterium]|nr:hypothetical protein [Bryobacterales bacterium]
PGEIYNIGGNRALPNLDVVRMILAATGKTERLLRTVEDRPGHDRRYALSSAKIQDTTGWTPAMDFEQGLARTVDWYLANTDWVGRVRSGAYRDYYDSNYSRRDEELGRVTAGSKS